MTSRSPIETNNVVERLREEADLCRNDGADDIAALLEEAADELQSLSDRIDVQREALEWIADRAVKLRKGTDDWFELVEFEGIARNALTASLTQGGKNV